MVSRTRTGARAAASRRVGPKDREAATAKKLVRVPDSARARQKGARRLKDANPHQRVDLTLTLRGPKLPDAATFAGRTPSLAQFRAKCGASKADANKVSQVLRKFGLSIDEVSLETRSMKVSGTVAEMEAAFHPHLGIYLAHLFSFPAEHPVTHRPLQCLIMLSSWCTHYDFGHFSWVRGLDF